ncbi:MAG: hypothetical protein QOK26_653, partial [Pseudonocardiales bacterium]|nr:hypothetical protein [Pseudonocardiales bacterium]
MSVAKVTSAWLCACAAGAVLLLMVGGALLVGLVLLAHPARTALRVRATVAVAIRVA